MKPRIINFYGGQRGDTLVNWLNGDIDLSKIKNYTACMDSKAMKYKWDFTHKWYNLIPDGTVDQYRELFTQYEQFLLNNIEKWHPSHSIHTAPAYMFMHRDKFEIFQIRTNDIDIPEVAANLLNKRSVVLGISPGITFPTARENVEYTFAHHIVNIKLNNFDLLSKLSNIKLNYLDYSKIFKEFNNEYFLEKFGRPVDDTFKEMVRLTTLPEVFETAAGPVKLEGGRLVWV